MALRRKPMVSGGVETILGVKIDPAFGPVVLFGAWRRHHSSVLGDVQPSVWRRLVEEAHEMVREGRAPPTGNKVAGDFVAASVVAHGMPRRKHRHKFLVLPKSGRLSPDHP